MTGGMGADVAPAGPSAGPFSALGGGCDEPVAGFRYDAVTDTWWWSDEMFALHGYRPGEVDATTDLLLSHKHPDDRARTEGTLAGALATGEPFCCRHRVIDAAGAVREVLSVGEGRCDEVGRVVSVEGYFVELTTALVDRLRSGAVRPPDLAVVEMAKGILVAAYRLEPYAALELLEWRSRQGDVALPELADGLVCAFSEADTADVTPASRAGAYLGLLADLEV